MEHYSLKFIYSYLQLHDETESYLFLYIDIGFIFLQFSLSLFILTDIDKTSINSHSKSISFKQIMIYLLRCYCIESYTLFSFRHPWCLENMYRYILDLQTCLFLNVVLLYYVHFYSYIENGCLGYIFYIYSFTEPITVILYITLKPIS